jgi:hypothetical protein
MPQGHDPDTPPGDPADPVRVAVMPYVDREGEPLDFMQRAELSNDPAYFRVARTMVTSAVDPHVSFDVSTIWLGREHSEFETAVFNKDGNKDGLVDDPERHRTEEAALRRHEEIVQLVAGQIVDPVLADAAGAEWERMVPRPSR